MGRTTLRKRGLLAALFVVVGLAMTVAVARAATPTITGATTPPVGHFSGTCPGCHVVEPSVPEACAPDATHADRSDEPTHVLDASGSIGPGRAVDHPDAQEGDSRVAASTDHPADRAQSSEHETVSPRVRERDVKNASPSDQGDKRPHSSDQSDASRHDGGGAGHGSSR
jgi:hypothetical protein